MGRPGRNARLVRGHEEDLRHDFTARIRWAKPKVVSDLVHQALVLCFSNRPRQRDEHPYPRRVGCVPERAVGDVGAAGQHNFKLKLYVRQRDPRQVVIVKRGDGAGLDVVGSTALLVFSDATLRWIPA
jgi:hypothetical protein